MEDYGPPFYNTDALYGEEKKQKPGYDKTILVTVISVALVILFCTVILGVTTYQEIKRLGPNKSLSEVYQKETTKTTAEAYKKESK